MKLMEYHDSKEELKSQDKLFCISTLYIYYNGFDKRI